MKCLSFVNGAEFEKLYSHLSFLWPIRDADTRLLWALSLYKQQGFLVELHNKKAKDDLFEHFYRKADYHNSFSPFKICVDQLAKAFDRGENASLSVGNPTQGMFGLARVNMFCAYMAGNIDDCYDKDLADIRPHEGFSFSPPKPRIDETEKRNESINCDYFNKIFRFIPVEVCFDFDILRQNDAPFSSTKHPFVDEVAERINKSANRGKVFNELVTSLAFYKRLKQSRRDSVFNFSYN